MDRRRLERRIAALENGYADPTGDDVEIQSTYVDMVETMACNLDGAAPGARQGYKEGVPLAAFSRRELLALAASYPSDRDIPDDVLEAMQRASLERAPASLKPLFQRFDRDALSVYRGTRG
jgi:hypothetical protein